MGRRRRVLSVVVLLGLIRVWHDVLELVVLEFVVVALELMLVGLQLPLVVLQRSLELLLEIGLGLRLHLTLLAVLLLHWLLLMCLILDGGSHHGGEALGQLGSKLELIDAYGRAGVLLLRGRRVLESLELVQLVVLVVLVLVLWHGGQAVVLRLGGLVVVHLGLQLAMLGQLLIVLGGVCAVDNRGGVALLHRGVFCLWGVLLLVHNEGEIGQMRRMSPVRGCQTLVGFVEHDAVVDYTLTIAVYPMLDCVCNRSHCTGGIISMDSP
jgi:hypothetical protein